MHPNALLDVYRREERELEQRLAYRLAAHDRSLASTAPSTGARRTRARAWGRLGR